MVCDGVPHLHDHPPQQPPHHVAPAHITGDHPITHQVDHGPDMVPNNLQGGLGGGGGCVVVQPSQLSRLGHNGENQVSLIVVGHSLQEVTGQQWQYCVWG
jgi:hypothetical protein